MRTRYRVWMNGQALDEIADSICITDIREKTPKMQAETCDRIGGMGTRLLRMARQSLSVAVRFAVREYDTARRREVLNKIRAWAKEGYLQTSDRPWLRLYVTCEKLPNADSALRWTDDVEMTLTAYDCPWWEEDSPVQATYSGSAGSVVIANGGTAESVLDAAITCYGVVDSMRISTGGRAFALSGLGMLHGDKVLIGHDQRGILSIRNGNGDSLMSHRTPESADDLVLSPGDNEILFTADASCTAVFSTRGRYE